MIKKVILTIIFVMILYENTYATSYEGLDLQKYDDIVTIGDEFKFSNITKTIIEGGKFDLNISNIFYHIIQIVFKEVFQNSHIVRNIILIAILLAILKILTENFKNKNVAEIGFYASFMVIISLLLSSFNVVTAVLFEAVDTVSIAVKSFMPLLSGVLILSGAYTSTLFTGFILTTLTFLIFFVKSMFIPFISATVMLNVINYITPREILNKLIEFLKWIMVFSLKVIASFICFIISIQKISSPILNGTVNKTVKTFINFVPIIGDTINGAIDGVMQVVSLVRGGVLVGVLIAILLCALIPIIKLIALIIMYKVTAVLIEPISDKRVVGAIDTLGEYTKIVLSCLILFTFIFMFFVTVILVIV